MDREHPVSAWSEWKIIEKIGEGSFGKVYKAQRTERGKTFYSAIKMINIPGSQGELNSVRSETGDDNSVREYFRNLVEECIQEISTMEYFRGNSHIVSVEDFKVMEYLDDIGWEISIRMEYLTSFMDYCAEKQLTEKEVIQLGLDLSKALEYCSKLKIIHRDIKPENIFVSRFGDFKLGDFGIARELERTMSGLSKKGTYSYMAPEMYKGEKYDSRVDIYSLGIVLYKLMNHNRLPFLNLEKQFITYRDKENALTRRMSGEKLKKPVDAGEEFSRIILKACAYDPNERYQKPEEFYQDLDDLKNGRFKDEALQKERAAEANRAQHAAVNKIPLQPTESAKVSDGKADGNKVLNQGAAGNKEPGLNAEANKTENRSTEINRIPARNTAANTPKAVNRSAEMTRISDRNPEENRTLVRNVEAYRASMHGSQESRFTPKETKSRKAQADRRRRKQRNTSNWALMVALSSLALMLVFAIYIMIRVNNVQQEVAPNENMVNILQDEKYSADKNVPKDFAAQIDLIKDRATTIVNNMDMKIYDWVGVEGDKIKYYNHDTGEYMKVLVYPGSSDEKVYEEYYYWNEKLFFAYIWYDTTAELYYYDDAGKLIRWIDEEGVCHDNETDNTEYVKRGEKYWNKSVQELE